MHALQLWHYTCAHGHVGLGQRGTLLPPRTLAPRQWKENPAVRGHQWMGDLIWLTDLDEPIPAALGLVRETLTCERWKYRYRVLPGATTRHWPGAIRRQYPAEDVRELENISGALPAHWWIATAPTKVVYDPARVTVEAWGL